MNRIVIKIEESWENDEKLKNYSVPSFNLWTLEILLKNSNSHSDHVWIATIETIIENQIYLSSDQLPLNYFDVAQIVTLWERFTFYGSV